MASSDEIEEPTAPFWMTTFSDMTTLLLTFFVMIVSMSEVEVKKFKEALSYFQGRTGVLQNESMMVAPGTPSTGKGKAPAGSPPGETRSNGPSPDDNFSVAPSGVPPVGLQPAPPSERERARDRAAQAERYEELIQYIQSEGLADKVQVHMTEKGLHFVLNDAVMFRPGAADLVEPSRTLLSLISTLLTDEVAQVVVEGHTDDRPIASVRYPSNWELSTARAAAVVRHFLGQASALSADHYSAVGKGEFHPLESNATDAGRSRNRRVEIFFLWT